MVTHTLVLAVFAPGEPSSQEVTPRGVTTRMDKLCMHHRSIRTRGGFNDMGQLCVNRHAGPPGEVACVAVTKRVRRVHRFPQHFLP